MYLFSTTQQKTPQLLPFPPAKSRLEELQKHVGGNIEMLPCGSNSPFMAYANDTGMIEDLPSNFLSWGVLFHLGFYCSMAIPFHFGNVVLMGRYEKALTKKQQAQVEEAVKKYHAEFEENDEEEEEEEEEGEEDEESEQE